MQKIYPTAKAECMCEIAQELWSWLSPIFKFPLFLIWAKFTSQFSSSFAVSSSDFYKKYGVTGLVFKINAIDGKRCVQQNSATLIYDVTTMKGTVASYLKK